MIYREEKKDLFSVSKEYYLAHCISADFAMGKGIAVEFNKQFDMKNQMIKHFPRNVWNEKGYCKVVPKIPVFNLITKEKYWKFPTYATLRGALQEMKVAAGAGSDCFVAV